ncbi:hypothetical protein ABZ714_02035 [Streptomyces sp. NPDC006798]|uniref:hypothetical protein n=1 Tax=Streptomyces sp. NPDC006798 TaxID=3155462 RepID=UPI0033DC7275
MTEPAKPAVAAESAASAAPTVSAEPAASVLAEPAEPVERPVPAPPSRRLSAPARWAVAGLVLAVFGTGSAVAVATADRADLPGLATRPDGRWEYPRLALPALPDGVPGPYHPDNQYNVHHADVRDLLLPAPKGAVVDPKLAGGWGTSQQYAAEYAPDERAEVTLALRETGVRHIAARGWRMPDGTVTRIQLLRFPTGGAADWFLGSRLLAGAEPGRPLAGGVTLEADPVWEATSGPEGTEAFAYREQGAVRPGVRQAYVLAGDTVAFVRQERAAGVAAVPFHQTLVLQNQLLG